MCVGVLMQASVDEMTKELCSLSYATIQKAVTRLQELRFLSCPLFHRSLYWALVLLFTASYLIVVARLVIGACLQFSCQWVFGRNKHILRFWADEPLMSSSHQPNVIYLVISLIWNMVRFGPITGNSSSVAFRN